MTGRPLDDAAPARWFSFALLGVSGLADAVGFLVLAGLYVSFMSGDATQLGVTTGHAQWMGVAKFLSAQLFFIAGAAIGRAVSVRTADRHRPVLLAVIAVLLVLASLGQDKTLSFGTAVLAMGMLNSVMHAANGVPVGSMITGALVRLDENIADRLGGRPAPIGENTGQCLNFVAAAALGTLAHRSFGIAALAVPALACAILAIAAGRNPHLRSMPRWAAGYPDSKENAHD